MSSKEPQKSPDRRLSKSEISNNEARLLAILGRMSDGIIALDRNWVYTYANDAAAKMLQRNCAADLIGRHIWTEFPEGIG